MNTDANISTVLAFNSALNTGHIDAMMRLLTADCVFEQTYPAPDGERIVGLQAVRAFWKWFFDASRNPRVEVEEIFSADDRVVMRWVYRHMDEQGQPTHARGVDVYRMREGRIAEMLSYVKG
jgi:ketosteroid isomerase-like protein